MIKLEKPAENWKNWTESDCTLMMILSSIAIETSVYDSFLWLVYSAVSIAICVLLATHVYS